jgi:uncharacterized protein Yka (UPF0111/DUF47 family)
MATTTFDQRAASSEDQCFDGERARRAGIRVRGIRLRLIPRDTGFYPLYCAQAGLVQEAASILGSEIGDLDHSSKDVARLRELRERGVELRREVANRAARTFVLPFGAGEVLGLSAAFDDLLGQIEEVGAKLDEFHVTEARPLALEQAELLDRACGVLGEAISELDDPAKLRPYPERIHAIEKEGDALYRRAIRRLFDGDANTRTVIIWKDVFAGLEEAIDAADAAGRVIERIGLTSQPATFW